MKKALITGTNGFVARRLKTYLNDQSLLEVVTTTANKDIVSTETGIHYLDLKHIDKVNFDFLEGIDVIFHLASMNEVDCASFIKDSFLVNGYASLKLYEEAATRGVNRFIYMSTAHVYGQQVGNISINSNVNPLHPYSISKYLGEQLIKASKSNLDFAILRMSNAFGYPVQKETSRWKLLVNDLCKQAVCDKKIQLNSSGKQYRNFVPLSEVLPLLEHFVYSNVIEWNKTYNISGFSSTVFEMAHKIAEISSEYLNASISVKTKEDAKHQNIPGELDFQGSSFSGFGNITVTLNSESTKQEVLQCLQQVEKFYN